MSHVITRPSTPLSDLPTLDERWLAFVAQTAEVFAAHPELVPLRQTIFKLFVEQKNTLSFAEQIKARAKPLVRRQVSTGDFSPVDVLFWIDNNREVLVDSILPVFKAIQAQGIHTRLVVMPKVLPYLDAAFAPVCVQAPHQRANREDWRRAWVDLRAVLTDELPEASWSAFLAQAAAAGSLAHEIERVFRQMRPRLVVLPVDQLVPGATVCTVARRMGIPSLVLLHGAVSPYNVPLTADKMAVWGEVSKDQLAALGVPPDDLIVLGSPRHDQFPSGTYEEARNRFRRALDLGESRYMVFFSNGNDVRRNSVAAVEGCVAWLEVAAERLAGQIEFIVRLHPNEDGRYYAKHARLRTFKNECDLDTTLNAADVCGALCSTALSDALLYQKPVLQFYADGWPHLADNWQRGLAERIAGPQQLMDNLQAWVADPQRLRAVIQQQQSRVSSVFVNHRRAAETVAQYIGGTYL